MKTAFSLSRILLFVVLIIPLVSLSGQTRIGFHSGMSILKKAAGEPVYFSYHSGYEYFKFEKNLSANITSSLNIQHQLEGILLLETIFRYTQYSTDYRSGSRSGFSTTNKNAELNLDKLDVGLIANFQIVNKPILYFGVGLNYSRYLRNYPTVININIKEPPFFGEDQVQAVKLFDIVNPNALEGIMKLEYVRPINEHIWIIDSFSYNQLLSRFLQSDFRPDLKIDLYRFIPEVGITYGFLND